MAAGISNGLVRMSVGITGTLEQRWLQLQQSYLAAMGAATPATQPAAAPRDDATRTDLHKTVDITYPPHLDVPPTKVPRMDGKPMQACYTNA